MKFKGFISQVGNPQSGTSHEGKQWTKRVITLGRKVTLDNGKEVEERILAEYFGDASQEELLQLAADKVTLDFTVWFAVRDWADPLTGTVKQFQSITLKNMARTM